MKPTTPESSSPSEVWYVPCRFMELADGSFHIKPLKPILRATAKRTSTLTGVSLKNLRILAEAGFVRVSRPTPGSSFFYPAEIETFIRQTEDDPNFWNKVRLATYLKCARLRDKRRRHKADDAA
jgi:hypothetical protein